LDPEAAASVREVLDEARAFGWLGPGEVETHLDHALGMAAAIGAPPGHFLDLGSGGGVPGLVLALVWPDARGLLLDAGRRRVEFLESVCARLGLAERISTRCERAEEAARRPELRGGFDLVVARGFGRPAVTAECGAGFLCRGGRLVVSEPPEDDPKRWPEAGLAQLGFGPATLRRSGDASVAVMVLEAPVGDRWPRRTGVPAKRPLWS
jgi:16S rRNA (guanine527-N7)-methyltransferase